MKHALLLLSLFYCHFGISQDYDDKLFLLGKTYSQYNILPYVNVNVKNKSSVGFKSLS